MLCFPKSTFYFWAAADAAADDDPAGDDPAGDDPAGDDPAGDDAAGPGIEAAASSSSVLCGPFIAREVGRAQGGSGEAIGLLERLLFQVELCFGPAPPPATGFALIFFSFVRSASRSCVPTHLARVCLRTSFVCGKLPHE